MAASATALSGSQSRSNPPLIVPVHRVMDTASACPPELVQRFWWRIWPEAFRDFRRCGIQLETTDATGEVRRSAGDRPIFKGLRRGAINLVLTDHIPMYWDDGHAAPGVSALYDGYHLCLIALRFAHGHQFPFLSVNTCVHELLHVLLQDIYMNRPKLRQAGQHEVSVDWHATRMWLFHDGSAIRKSAEVYLNRLRSEAVGRRGATRS